MKLEIKKEDRRLIKLDGVSWDVMIGEMVVSALLEWWFRLRSTTNENPS